MSAVVSGLCACMDEFDDYDDYDNGYDYEYTDMNFLFDKLSTIFTEP